MDFPPILHVLTALGTILALDAAIAALAITVADNWPAIRAALRGEDRP